MAPSYSYVNHAAIEDLFDAALEKDLTRFKEAAKEIDVKGEGISKILRYLRHEITGNSVLHNAVVGGLSRGEANVVVKYLVEELKLDVNVQDDCFGNTPLHITASCGELVTSAYLLDHGANYNKINHDGESPFHAAARTVGTSVGQKKVLKLLISKGAKVNLIAAKETQLFYAAQKGWEKAVEVYLENNADPNLVLDGEDSPLLAAIQARSVDCVRLLLKWGADPNLSICGENPLHSAFVKGHAAIVKCLLNAGADPNALNFWGLTPIEVAAMHGTRSVVVTLLPATSPVPTITDWSVQGILNYVNSIPFKTQRNLVSEEKFTEAKAKGDEAYSRKQYHEAKNWYSVAHRIKPDDEKVLSNRSLCYACLQDGRGALKDASACIKLKSDWAKAHYQAGVAWQLLRNYGKAASEFEVAHKLEPMNKEIENAYRKATQDSRRY